MRISSMELLEPRLQFSSIQYGVAASGDPDVTGVLAETGPGLKDLGATGVRLFTNTSFLSSDFGTTPSGKIYVRNPSLVTSLAYAKKYHDAGIAVTSCIQLSIDRSMYDGSLLINPVNGKTRKLVTTELRAPKVFGAWYDALSKAQISKTDKTSVTKVLDFWEIGNEVNISSYWPIDPTVEGIDRIGQMLDSYVDHQLIPAYDVLSKLNEPVIGAAVTSGTLAVFNRLNNQAGSRKHQYSDHCDYLNFHPYGFLGSPVEELTPQGVITAFTTAMYGDGTVKKPFVISEYNLSDFGHVYPLDPTPNPRDAADQFGIVNDLDKAHDALLASPHVQEHCAWIHYYRLIADDRKTRGGLFYPPPGGQGAMTPITPLYGMFQRWATDATAPAPVATSGVTNLGTKFPANDVAVQKDGKTLVVSDDGVRRYGTDGKIDKTYGVNGFAKLPLICKTAAIQGDGNLIVGGSANDEATRNGYHMVVTRLSTAGKVDKGFATNGNYSFASGTGSQARTIALRSEKIIIAGQTSGIGTGVVVRLDLAGQPDPTFGANGVTVVKARGAISEISVSKKGVITGLVNPYKIEPQALLVRINASGDWDTSFSKDGIGEVHLMTGDGMFLDPDGSVLLIGHAPLAERQVAVRYTATGAIDVSFGDGGVQKIGGKKFIRSLPVETADGSRYLVGSIAPTLTSDAKRIFVSRLSSDAQIDPGFGADGVLTLASKNLQDIPFATYANGNSLTIVGAAFTAKLNGGITQELFAV